MSMSSPLWVGLYSEFRISYYKVKSVLCCWLSFSYFKLLLGCILYLLMWLIPVFHSDCNRVVLRLAGEYTLWFSVIFFQEIQCVCVSREGVEARVSFSSLLSYDAFLSSFPCGSLKDEFRETDSLGISLRGLARYTELRKRWKVEGKAEKALKVWNALNCTRRLREDTRPKCEESNIHSVRYGTWYMGNRSLVNNHIASWILVLGYEASMVSLTLSGWKNGVGGHSR